MERILLCKTTYELALKVLKQIVNQKYPYQPLYMKTLTINALLLLTADGEDGSCTFTD